MKSFIPETFLVFISLAQLLFNARIINSTQNNSPIIDKETVNQTVLILVWVFLLVYNLQLESCSTTTFFLHNIGCKIIKLIIIFFSILVTYIILPIFIAQKLNFFEFFSFFLYSILSFLLIVNAHNLMSLYLVIEMQALCFYVLASFNRTSAISTEAGLKYFILSSFMSGFFLFGTSFIYGTLGTLSLAEIFNLLVFNLDNFNLELKLVLFIGILFILFTLLFKLACAPFHFWAPDVYEGAPLSSTVIFSVLPKISLIFFFSKFIFSLNSLVINIQPLLLFFGVFSCFIGTLYSLYQKRIKRLVIYSSIAQIGFVVAGLSLNTIESVSSVFMFLIIYSITSTLLWGHIVCFYYFNFKINTFKNLPFDILNITHFIGFFLKNKAWTISMVIIFFSLAGIPPFTGFWAKIVILLELIASQKLIISCLLIIISSISVFYYIRLIKMFFFEPKNLLKNIRENFQIIFLDDSIKKLCFIFVILLFSLIIILIYPTKLYLFCQYITLKVMF